MALDSRLAVLIVDDDRQGAASLADILQQEGYRTHVAANADEALASFDAERPAAVLLEADVGGTGWEIARSLRDRSRDPALIFVTTRTAELDRVRGLRLGADDYIAKPYGVAELLARLEAVLRRTRRDTRPPPRSYRDRIVSIDLDRHEVLVRGRPVSFSPTEYRLLVCLVEHAGQVLSPDALLQCAWKDGSGSPEQVKLYIGYLRKKLERDPTTPRLIQTIRSIGYRYERRVEE